MDGPTTVRGRANWVEGAVNRAPTIKPMELLPAEPHTVVDSVFQAQATKQESATPIDRSVALIIRLIPITGVWLVLSVALVLVLGVNMQVGFIAFAGLTALSYYKLDDRERFDSPVGVEHHRIDAAHDLAIRKLEHDATLKRELLQTWAQSIGEGSKHHDDRAQAPPRRILRG